MVGTEFPMLHQYWSMKALVMEGQEIMGVVFKNRVDSVTQLKGN